MRAYAALAAVAIGVGAAAAHGCTSARTTSGSGGGASACTPCLKDADCGDGNRCGQFAGDAFCAPDCTDPASPACSSDRACSANPITTNEGQQANLCIPIVNVCGGGSMASGNGGMGPGATATTSATSSGTGGNPEICGSLDGPDIKACCTSCMKSGKTCQANGCYGGWWCNKDTCQCQQPPVPSSCGGSSSSATTTTSTTSTGVGGGGPSGIGPKGGKLAGALNFAIVGDTRPPVEDDIAAYPTAVITKIWQDVQSQGAAFAVSTGDYMFAKPYNSNGSADQINLYLGARKNFVNQVFPAMGNHECTGGVSSNCGSANVSGNTVNYVNFLNMMLKGISTTPWYWVEIDDQGGKWTSKFVFVAANAWDDNQAAWLDSVMQKSTTYTFVVRHEATIANQAPGVDPSDQIVAKYPYTVMICGHTHEFAWKSYARQVVVGNGGAPLTGGGNYGYVIATQRKDGNIQFHAYDYSTNAVTYSFALTPDGKPTQ